MKKNITLYFSAFFYNLLTKLMWQFSDTSVSCKDEIFPGKRYKFHMYLEIFLKRNYKISPELGKLRSLKISFHLSWSCGLTWLAKIVWLSDSNSNWINWRTVHSEVSIMRGNWTYLLKNQPTEDFISLFRSSAELSCPLCSICHWKLINSSQYLLEELLN